MSKTASLLLCIAASVASFSLPAIATENISQVHAAETTKGNYVATIGNIGITQPWSRALPPTAKVGATFVDIHNLGLADKLISANSPISETTELHTHIHDNGLMKMVEVEEIEIAENSTTQLKPGSYHIMLIDLKQPLIEGERFPIRLDFANSGSIELEVEVRNPNAGTAVEHVSH